ncbi:hypothetical protein GKZ89_02530 [Bacillus mangrovi]|uniref:Bacterial Pleckstrin homology domain-containing protein n=1 Tax=Metabacillus mangrovi TaxID=1491830 RepID=A0A7X2S318_9BACI|nr:hypothetical protein [Metabacillus mangrovi]MTH52268.1 hypothetical protein [Metabacillus mangrovi]
MTGRKVELYKDKAVIRLPWINGLFALKFSLELPYETIEEVIVTPFTPPQFMLRMPGTSIGYLKEGSYKYRGEWYFLSFAHRIPLLNIRLRGHDKYTLAVIEVEKPTEAAAEIRRKIREYEEGKTAEKRAD